MRRMDSASVPPTKRKQSARSAEQEAPLLQVVCRLPPEEHRRFTVAAERHGAGSTSGQMRVLIREWMRGLNQPDLEDVAA
jgi:hypothetical protein